MSSADPTRPIRLVVILSPGAGTDVPARLAAQHLDDAPAHALAPERRNPPAEPISRRQSARRAAPQGAGLTWQGPQAFGTHLAAQIRNGPGS